MSDKPTQAMWADDEPAKETKPTPQKPAKTEKVELSGEGHVLDLPSKGLLGYPSSVQYREMYVKDEETIAQVKDLESFQNCSKLRAVVNIDIDTGALLSRLCGRRTCLHCGKIYHIVDNPPPDSGVCGNCQQGQVVQRSDDTEEKVKNRLQVFQSETQPVVDHYRKTGIYHEVAGHGKPAEVFERIESSLASVLSSL